MFYYYCYKLNRPEKEFYENSLGKVCWIIDKSVEREQEEKDEECKSMRQFLKG